MARSRALTVCVCRSVVAAAFSFCTGRQAGSLTSATVGVSTPGTRADSARPTDGRTDDVRSMAQPRSRGRRTAAGAPALTPTFHTGGRGTRKGKGAAPALTVRRRKSSPNPPATCASPRSEPRPVTGSSCKGAWEGTCFDFPAFKGEEADEREAVGGVRGVCPARLLKTSPTREAVFAVRPHVPSARALGQARDRL